MKSNRIAFLVIAWFISIGGAGYVDAQCAVLIDMTDSHPDILNNADQAQTQFNRGDTVKVRFNMHNGGLDGLSADVVLNVRDSTDTVFYDSHVVFENIAISNWGANQSISVTFSITIPANAPYGQCDILGSVRDGGPCGGWNVILDTTDPGCCDDTAFTWLLDKFEIIQSSPPPQQATNPNPSDGETNVSTSTNLSWDDGGGATSYDVYFGTDPNPSYQNTVTSESYDPPGTLANSQVHYWKIVAKNAEGNTPGPVWEFTTASLPTVATPTFSPDGGTYSDSQSVVINCATAGATIRYTTDGDDPTTSDPIISNGGSVPVNQSLTLKAKAWKNGFNPSNVKSATYTINDPLPVTISGHVKTSTNLGIEGVQMNGLPSNPPPTDTDGYYSAVVNYGWTGTVTPHKSGFTFTPSSKSYSNVTSDRTNEDYTAIPPDITGRVTFDHERDGFADDPFDWAVIGAYINLYQSGQPISQFLKTNAAGEFNFGKEHFGKNNLELRVYSLDESIQINHFRSKNGYGQVPHHASFTVVFENLHWYQITDQENTGAFSIFAFLKDIDRKLVEVTNETPFGNPFSNYMNWIQIRSTNHLNVYWSWEQTTVPEFVEGINGGIWYNSNGWTDGREDSYLFNQNDNDRAGNRHDVAHEYGHYIQYLLGDWWLVMSIQNRAS